MTERSDKKYAKPPFSEYDRLKQQGPQVDSERSGDGDAVSSAEWKRLVELAREEGFLAGRLSALSATEFDLKRAAYVMGMALLQSSVPQDEEVIGARDMGVSLGQDRDVMFNRRPRIAPEGRAILGGNYDPNESPAELAKRLEKVKSFVAACQPRVGDCPKCGVNRLEAPCPYTHSSPLNCPMKGESFTQSPQREHLK